MANATTDENRALAKAVAALLKAEGKARIPALREAVNVLVGMSGLPRSEVTQAVEDWA